MNPKYKMLHERALAVAAKYRRAEAGMVRVLRDADAVKLHRGFGLSSLLKYAVEYLNLSEPVALAFIAVARKSVEVAELAAAIDVGTLSVSAANRIVSSLNRENAAELIQFAATHSWRETEREVATRNPRAARPDKVKFISKDLVQVMITVSVEDLGHLERAASLEAQRTGRSPTKGEVIRVSLKTHLDKYDPVRKAERAQKKHSVRTDQIALAKTAKSAPYGIRVPPTAAQKQAVNRRDQGRCTHVDQLGRRCNQDRWVETHHLVQVSDGGSNEPTNLMTLCSFHHDLVHQLSLPIDGQITWLRSPSLAYEVRTG